MVGIQMKPKVTKIEKKSIAALLPLIVVLAVVPLVCIIHKYETGLISNNWFSKVADVYDFFLYYKSKVLLLVGIALAAIIAGSLYSKKETLYRDGRSKQVLVCLGCFVAFSLLSVLFSHDIKDAFWGGYEQWEGVIALVAYALIFLFTYAFIHYEEEAYTLFGAYAIGALIVGVLGACQAYGYDYMKSKWMHGILTALESRVLNVKVDLTFGEGMVYSTLYNPNYVGSYVTLALPVMIGLVIWSKKVWQKAVGVVAAVTLVVSLFCSRSITGLIGIAASVVMLGVFVVPWLVRRPKAGIAVLGCVAVMAVVAVLAKPAFLVNILDREVQEAQNAQAQGKHMIDAISIRDGEMAVTTNPDGRVRVGITYKDGFQYDVRDEQSLQGVERDEASHALTVTIRENEVLRFTQTMTDHDGKTYPMLILSGGGDSWSFLWKKGELQYKNAFGKLDGMREIPRWGFADNQQLATSRGYIWSRTFPLLPGHILVGCGPDNFVYEFPNDDYVGKRNNGFEVQIMSKPHNMYLQIWVQEGLVALLGMLGIYLLYVIDTFRQYFARERKGFLPRMGICIFLGTVGFMVTGLANDSTICVTPLYWAMLGLGFTINRMAGAVDASD